MDEEVWLSIPTHELNTTGDEGVINRVLELDEQMSQQLKKLYKELESEGKLPSKQQLSEYYATFRKKFGPDTLANLDGEALLETMHSHGNKESLVYWLEFKDDEECPALFGSIAGGSAYKFGLFRKKELGRGQLVLPEILKS